MSSVQNIESPRPQRPKHQHSRSATQVTQGPNGSTSNTNNSNNNGRQSQRRTRGNRAHNGHNQHGGPAGSPSRSPANPDPAFADSAVLSSEDMQLPTGPRTAKKHTRSQPSADRVFSPTSLPPASLTDTEGAPSHLSATPAKAQAAYAGPTFHASPAASALPIPKFLSKSVPAKARSGPPTPPPDETSDSGNSLSPSPSPSRGAPIPVPPRHEDSPLDMLFKADRAEKARNANCSPASVTTSNPSNPASAHGRPQHHKQDSFSSLNAVFPIELDGESKATHISPPPAGSPGHRSVTAPSMLPQTDNSAMPNGGSDPIQDLFNRLSMSQKKPNAATPPGTINRVPSEPQSRHHSPSPFHDDRASFRSASGPTTPAPAAQEPSDFFYGNRNLSPLFKAAKNDSAKRNSGLRTEITADSPMMAKDTFHDFPSITPPNHADPNAVSRGFLENMVAGAPAGPRRGSAPHVQPPREMQNHNNNRKARTPGRTNNYHNYHPRPDSRSQANGNRTNGAPSTSAPKASTMMSFIPSSVAAKQHSTTPPLTKTPTPDTLALEQDLKRVLNLKLAGDMTGVR